MMTPLAAVVFILVAPSVGLTLADSPERKLRGADLVEQIKAGKTIDETDATITGALDLRGVDTVSAPIRCLNCDFTGPLIAPDVIFSRIVVLSGGRFHGQIDLRGAIFKDGLFVRTSLRRSTFDAFALFSLATFEGTAAFDESTFRGEANFTSTRFEGDASFINTNFQGIARFQKATFGGRALFSASVVRLVPQAPRSCAQAVDGRISGEAVFAGVVFTGSADFRQRCFGHRADFRASTFQSRANFARSEFNELTTFNDTDFQGDANFLAARFWSHVKFPQVAAARTLDYEDTIFLRHVDFSRLTVAGSLSFANTALYGGASMPSLIAENLTMDPAIVSRIDGFGPQKRALSLIEASAKVRGEIATANDAHFRLLSLQNENSSAPKRWVDIVFYRTIAGYLVRPLHPLLAFLALIALGGAVRAAVRRQNDAGGTRAAGPSRRRRKGRFRLAFVKSLSHVFGGLADTLNVAFRTKPHIEMDDRDEVRTYVVAGTRWTEYLTFKVLIALFLLCLANSNATLRQLIDSVIG